MNILVINGSPKGKYSVTLHTCLYLEKKFSGQHFEYINAGQKIKTLEKDFSPALEAIAKADLLEEKGRKQAHDWFEMTLWNLDKGYFKKPSCVQFPFAGKPCSIPESVGKSAAKKAVIVTDIKPDDTALKAMVDSFIARFPYGCNLVNSEENTPILLYWGST